MMVRQHHDAGRRLDLVACVSDEAIPVLTELLMLATAEDDDFIWTSSGGCTKARLVEAWKVDPFP